MSVYFIGTPTLSSERVAIFPDSLSSSSRCFSFEISFWIREAANRVICDLCAALPLDEREYDGRWLAETFTTTSCKKIDEHTLVYRNFQVLRTQSLRSTFTEV